MSPMPCADDADETPFAGGATQFAAARGTGMRQIVRVGGTVRRSAGPWSSTIHSVLHHLESHDFEGAPRALGFDSEGREVLTYIAGQPGHFGFHPSPVLAAVGRLVRRFHDTVRSWQPDSSSVWMSPLEPFPGKDCIVCHNDVNPTNVIFRDHRPIALVDWECAGPNPIIAELAQMAWAWVPLFHDELLCEFASPLPSIPELAHRLTVLCDGYGLADRSDLIPATLMWLDLRHDAMKRGHDPRLAAMWRSEQRTYTEATIAWLERNADELSELTK